MAREFLKGVKSENRLSKVRLIMPNDPVIGGQPSDNADEFTSNTPFLDLACSIQYAVTQAANANTAAKNADTKAVNAQTTANQAKAAAATADGKAVAAQKTADEAKTAAATADSKAIAADKKAGTAQTTANQAKTAAATADGKAVAAQKTADEAKTAAATADSKAVAAQKTADEAKTAAATADSKAVAAQNTANTANTAAKNADTKAANAQTTATGAKTAADNAQKKANQVPNPVLDQLPIGASGTAYKLITIADLKTKLGVPAKTNVVQTTGTSTTAVMSQKAVTDVMGGLLKAPRNVKNERVLETTYTNTTNGILIVTVSCAYVGGAERAPVNVKIDGVELITGLGTRVQTFQYVITAFVPPKSKYSVHCTGANFSSWVEQSI